MTDPIAAAPTEPTAGAGTDLRALRPTAGAHGPADHDEGLSLPAPRVLALVAFVAVIFWLARPVLAPFVIAAVIAYAFTPVVTMVEERTGLRHGLAVLGLFVAALVLMGVLVAIVGGRLAAELQLLASSGPDALATLLRQLAGGDEVTLGDTKLRVADIAAQLEASIAATVESPTSAIHLASQVGEIALEAVLALIVTFYLLLDGFRLRDAALRFVSPPNRSRVLEVGGHIHVVLGRWLRGQALLIALVAAVVYVILGPILHVPYALAIGLLTGVLEIIPLVGPIIAAAIAGVVAFSAGGSGLALTVLVIFFVLRQVEDQVVMPVVIGRAVHLHPVVTIFAVLVGISAWGILGGLLAVPVAAAINVTLRELYPETAVAADVAVPPAAEPLTAE